MFRLISLVFPSYFSLVNSRQLNPFLYGKMINALEWINHQAMEIEKSYTILSVEFTFNLWAILTIKTSEFVLELIKLFQDRKLLRIFLLISLQYIHHLISSKLNWFRIPLICITTKSCKISLQIILFWFNVSTKSHLGSSYRKFYCHMRLS